MILKSVASNNSLRHDLDYDLYLRLSHMFIPNLTVVFKKEFQQGSITDRIYRGASTLPNKDKHIWWGLGNYRP